jgi:hypothetical protein
MDCLLWVGFQVFHIFSPILWSSWLPKLAWNYIWLFGFRMH